MATSITLTTNSSTSEYTLATGGRGPVGPSPTAAALGLGTAATATPSDSGLDILTGTPVEARAAIDAQPLLRHDTEQFLTLPIADGFQSCTHPSVVHIPEGWSGYQYWMSATPFPTSARENPHVWASHDGSTWETPTGLTNPVQSELSINGHSYSAWSDPRLLLLHAEIAGYAAGTMILFGRPFADSGSDAIYFKTSTDGVNWSANVESLFGEGGAVYHYISPSFVQEDDGTVTMWAVNGVTGTMRKYTSSNLTTWTSYAASTLCVFRNTLTAGVWHADIQKRRGKYHALITQLSTYVLSYCVSDDGITWVGQDGPQSVITRETAGMADSAMAFDKRNFYKSCFLPSAAGPGLWDMWIVTVGSQLWNDPDTAATVNQQFTSIHRIHHRKAVRLGKPRLHVQKSGGGTTSIASGSYTLVTFPSLVATDWWDGTNSRFQPPAGWYSLTAMLHWSAAETVGSRYITIFKNGTSLGLIGGENIGAAGQGNAITTYLVYANGTDYYDVRAYQVTGSSCTIINDAGTNFQAIAAD